MAGKRVLLTLHPKLHEKLKNKAERNIMSMQELITDILRESVWDIFIKKNLSCYVRLTTTNNKQILGWIWTIDDYSPYDIILKDPYIYKDDEPISLGENMYFPHHSIQHIVRVKIS